MLYHILNTIKTNFQVTCILTLTYKQNSQSNHTASKKQTSTYSKKYDALPIQANKSSQTSDIITLVNPSSSPSSHPTSTGHSDVTVSPLFADPMDPDSSSPICICETSIWWKDASMSTPATSSGSNTRMRKRGVRERREHGIAERQRGQELRSESQGTMQSEW